MAVKEKNVKKGVQKKRLFHEMTDKELESNLLDFKKELQEVRFNTVTSGYSNVSRFKTIKRNIARVLTVQKIRELKQTSEQQK